MAAGVPAFAPAAHWAFGLNLAPMQLLEPIASGLVGGIIAGSIAISLYLASRRSAAREKKYAQARVLCVELSHVLGAAPDTGLDRSTVRPAYRLELARGVHGKQDGLGRPAQAPGHVPQGILGSAYGGLVSSGGISVFEAALQERLYRFYDRLARGDYDTVYEQAALTMREVALLRDANAPPALRARLRRGGARTLSLLRRRHGKRMRGARQG